MYLIKRFIQKLEIVSHSSNKKYTFFIQTKTLAPASFLFAILTCMKNYFKGTKEHPYHLSVGAVAINEKNEVCCHYFTEIKGHASFAAFKNFYILMRETVEMGESIEETLHRGLKEEFGITGEIIDYLGSIRDEYFDPGKVTQIEKTTLYFLVKIKDFKPELRSREDVEVESKIEWHSCDYLIEKMKEQEKRLGNVSLDESSILEKVKTYIINK